MKHIKKFENYTQQDIKNLLLSAQKKNEIEMKIPVDDIIKNINARGNSLDKIGTFEGFVEDEANFISFSNWQNMREFVKKFKELGVDTKKLEELLPKCERYWEISIKELDNIERTPSHEYGSLDNKMKKLNALRDEEEELLKFVDEFEIEVKNVAKKANSL